MAEDATQDVFTALLAGRRYEGLEKPLNYLYRSASNACIDRIRQRASTPVLVSLDDAVLATRSGSERVLARDLLDQTFAGLSRRAIEVAFCVHLDGMTQEEAAEHLRVSRKTVQRDLVRISRALEEVAGEGIAP